MEPSKEIKEKIFKAFRTWEARTYPNTSETSLSDWNIGQYKEVFIISPRGGRRGNYLYFVKDDRCVGFSPAFADIESIYQKFLRADDPKKS